MADELIPPGIQHIINNPVDNSRVPTPRRPTESSTSTVSAVDWVKIEAIHFAASLVLGALAYGLTCLIGYDTRVGLIVGILTVLFGRNVTRLFIPDHKTEVATATAAGNAPPTDTFREIVETVVFVVVLVLLLKSFVAEAFVIPTGSMATTLWGYQKVVDCPECGYRFPVNCSLEADPQDGQPAQPVRGCTCPNCRYVIDFGGPGRPDPSWSSGDRVLVAKFLYDLLGRMPERLDVVVFKFPGDSPLPWPQSGPFGRNYVPMNYIKRLIGLPGEIIAIHGGNLYSIPTAKVPEEERAHFKPDEEETGNSGGKQLWQMPYTHTKFGAEARSFFDKNRELFHIIRKPPETMMAQRRIVYDNDHPPRDIARERWVGNGWTASGQGFIRSSARDETDWLRYRHTLRTDGGNPQLIADFMGYNSARSAGFSSGRQSGLNWVGDLMLECDVAVEKSEGTLTLELSRGIDRFNARFDLGSGTCKLVRLTDAGEQELGSQPTTLKKPGTYHLRFCDFDERLTVWIDNTLPFGDGVDFPPPAQTGPREKNDLDRPASIGSSGSAVVHVNHLQVWRDTYYTVSKDAPNFADVSGINFADPKTWADLDDMPIRTIDIQPGHFLCLGDNSPESSDGRTWGLVPERLLLGRALLVYFPFNRAGRIR